MAMAVTLKEGEEVLIDGPSIVCVTAVQKTNGLYSQAKLGIDTNAVILRSVLDTNGSLRDKIENEIKGKPTFSPMELREALRLLRTLANLSPLDQSRGAVDEALRVVETAIGISVD